MLRDKKVRRSVALHSSEQRFYHSECEFDQELDKKKLEMKSRITLKGLARIFSSDQGSIAKFMNV